MYLTYDATIDATWNYTLDVYEPDLKQWFLVESGTESTLAGVKLTRDYTSLFANKKFTNGTILRLSADANNPGPPFTATIEIKTTGFLIEPLSKFY